MGRKVARKVTMVVGLSVVLAASVAWAVGASTHKSPASPVITAQPSSTAVKLSAVAHFKVKASGNPKPTYQWQVSTGGGPFADLGTSSSTLSVTATTANGGSIYQVVVTNPSGSVTSQTATLSIKPSKVQLKPLLEGLIDKGSEAQYHEDVPYPVIDLSDVAAQSPAFGGVVVNQTWAQLEPTQGQFDFSTLDASLAVVDAYNAQHPDAPLGVRLRVFAAYAAPDWAKTLDGPAITVPANPPDNTGGTLGEWWMPGYRSAWAALQQALAGRYDDNPVLNEVAVSSCSSLTAEPFVLGPDTIAAATPDGWTTAAQQSCLDGAFSDYAPWTHTAIYYPMNPLDGDQTITDEVMQRCVDSASSGGPTCILANNALSPVSATTGRSAPTYAEMHTLWASQRSSVHIAFQMNGPDSSTYCAAIGVAVSYHARSVELWPASPGQPGFTTVPTATLVGWDNALRKGKQPSC